MYWLFRLHHISPIDVHRLNRREKNILFAFMRYEMKQREDEAKEEEAKTQDIMDSIDAGR